MYLPTTYLWLSIYKLILSHEIIINLYLTSFFFTGLKFATLQCNIAKKKFDFTSNL